MILKKLIYSIAYMFKRLEYFNFNNCYVNHPISLKCPVYRKCNFHVTMWLFQSSCFMNKPSLSYGCMSNRIMRMFKSLCGGKVCVLSIEEKSYQNVRNVDNQYNIPSKICKYLLVASQILTDFYFRKQLNYIDLLLWYSLFWQFLIPVYNDNLDYHPNIHCKDHPIVCSL